jgi:hypothetical protein
MSLHVHACKKKIPIKRTPHLIAIAFPHGPSMAGTKSFAAAAVIGTFSSMNSKAKEKCNNNKPKH